MDPVLEGLALEKALTRESGWLAGLARSLVRDPQRAEDAVQETLVAALERRHEPRRSLRGWLRTVLASRLAQQGRASERRQWRERARAEERLAPDAGEVHERLELQAAVVEAVAGLEEPYRSAIVARYLDGESPREVARRRGLPVRTVHTHLERGLGQLRARLDGRFGERARWVRALVTLTGAGRGPLLQSSSLAQEALLMGTGTKVALAAATLIGVAWLGKALLESGPRGEGRGEVLSTSGEPALPSREGAGFRPAGERSAPPGAGPSSVDSARELVADTRSAPTPTILADGLVGHGMLSVRVRRRSDRAGIAGVEVTVKARTAALLVVAEDPLARASTDERGLALLRVPAAQALRVAFQPADHDPAHPIQGLTLEVPDFAPDEERALDVDLPDGLDRLFYGRVIAAEDRRALPEAVLVPVPDRGRAASPIDARGHFTLAYASFDPDELEVHCAGYASAYLGLGRVDQTPAEPYIVALERAAAIEARVDSASDRSALQLVASLRDGRGFQVALDRDGRGTLEDLPVRAKLTLELRFEGHSVWKDPEPWTLEPGERRALELSLEDGCLLFGTLRDDHGRPVEEQCVMALPAGEREGFSDGSWRFFKDCEDRDAVQARCERGGGFEFSSLAPGRWWIGPRPGQGPLPAYGLGIEIHPGDYARRLDLEGRQAWWIRGRVFGPDGELLRPCQVDAQRAGDRGHLVAETDDGSFELGPLVEGEYLVRAYGDGVFGWGPPVEARAGDENVEVHVGRTDSIGGLVVDEEGRGIEAQVHLLRRSSSLGMPTSQVSQGAFLFTGLEPGVYTVQAGAPDGRVALQRVELAEGQRIDDVRLTLRVGTRIGVRHDLERNVRVSIWCGDALAADSTVRPGEECFEIVPAGPIRVELYGGGRTLGERLVEARVGRVETVAFDLE